MNTSFDKQERDNKFQNGKLSVVVQNSRNEPRNGWNDGDGLRTVGGPATVRLNYFQQKPDNMNKTQRFEEHRKKNRWPGTAKAGDVAF